MVKVELHGILAKQINPIWNLDVESVSEALHAIEVMSNQKLYKTFLENDKKGIKYQVLINKRDFISEKPLDIENPETIINSELVIKNKAIKEIDIVPILEVAEDVLQIVIGAVLIIVGILVLPYFPVLGGALILGGIGLIASGVINLLSKPPKFDDFKSFPGGRRQSYLFNGPENTVGEGGPVPIIYGELLVGSQVISASYEIEDTTDRSKGLTN